MPTTISEYIARDLASRIGPRVAPPPELTIPALSRHYGVSFTPVREALRCLVDEGLLLKGGNGRVRVNPCQVPAGRREAAEASAGLPSHSERIEAKLAAEVVARSLRGEDGFLREEATARLLGVGRTVIRHALSRLAGRGLIVHVPRCGWRVRVFDAADLAAYLDVRESLELKALGLARPRLVESDLRRMLCGNAPNGSSQRLDNNLHRYLVEKSENAYIRDFFDRHGAYYTTLFDYAAPETKIVGQMARQHRTILRALLDKDWRRAARALRHHIRAQRPIIEELLRRVGRKGPSKVAPDNEVGG